MSMKLVNLCADIKGTEEDCRQSDKDTNMNVYWRVDVQLYLFLSSDLD